MSRPRRPASSGLAEAAEGALLEVVEERIFAAGGQVAVMLDDELVVSLAVGESGGGREMDPGHLHNVYCLVKPFSFLLLADVLERAGFGADDLLNELVELPSWCPKGLTFRRLACHGAGLGEPSGMEWRIAPRSQRPALLSRATRNPEPAYSEIAGGLVCEHVIERISGRPASEYCTDELLRPLGLLGEVIVEADAARMVRDRVRAPVSGLPVHALPMLSELLPDQIGEIRLAFGALATMRGIAGLFAAAGRVMSGQQTPGLPTPGYLAELLSDGRPMRHDPTLKRPAKWSGGLMVDLRQQSISQIAGEGSVGHVGGPANSAALFDPARQASVAVYLNGVGADFHDQALPRQHILDSVLSAIPTA